MKERELKMAAPAEVYRRRRARLAAGLKRPLAVFAGRPRARNYVGLDYPFRAASTYLYLGGPPLEGAAWVIEPGADGTNGCALVRPAREPDEIVWMGEPVGDDLLASAAGVPASALHESDAVEALLGKREAAAICPPCLPTREWARTLGLKDANPDELLRVIEMRNVKDEHELAAMREAARVGVQAHLAAMADTAPGRSEMEVAAVFSSTLMANGCVPSFTPIVTVRGEILHCMHYRHRLEAGGLLLVDGGAEEPGGYASDNTRTLPIDGAFTAMQLQLYDTVLAAQRAAITECVPGRRYRDVHDRAALVICEGLVEAGLLRGRPQSLFERRAHTLFFPHGVGHLIGLDTHDMEDFGDLAGYATGRARRKGFGDNALRLDRDLEPGMTVTIEPGVYLVPAIWRRDDLVRPLGDCVNRSVVEELLRARFGGIRLEDVIHVRADGGPENLTESLPIEADAVVEAMRGGRA